MSQIIKRKKISLLWNFFTEFDESFAICNLCRTKLSYKTSTSNLKRHLEIKHPSVPLVSGDDQPRSSRRRKVVVDSASDLSLDATSSESEQPADSSISVVPPSVPVTPKLPKQVTTTWKQTIDEKLLRLFTDSYQPLRIVEEPAFRQFVVALNESYELPNKHMISTTLIPAMYEKCVDKTRKVLTNAKKVSVTTDCWTSINIESYMAVSVHFLDENFSLISLLLECASLPVQYTSINLASELKRILTEWHVKKQLLMVVSDNGSDIKAAVEVELGWKHIGCFAHTINLIVDDALKEDGVFKAISKVKHVVGHYKMSQVATTKLLLYQQNQGSKNPIKLIQDVSNRWNSSFYMLERFLLLEDAIKSTIVLTNTDVASHLTMDEWEIIRQFCQILKPFQKVTKTISGDKYLIASLIIPLVNGLTSVYKGFVSKPLAECIKNVVAGLNLSLSAMFDGLENNITLSIATFLDPRFKQIAFRDKRNSDYAEKNVISLMTEKFLAKQNSSTDNEPIPSTSTQKKAYGDSDTDDDVWAEFDKEAAEYQPKETCTSKAITEVQRFLHCDMLKRQEDPLKWWRENKYMFPQLALVAQERLSVIATSVPCERLFSKDGQIILERRSRLSSTKANMLLFLNSNSNL